MKKLIFPLFVIISNFCFGQLVSGEYHDLTISVYKDSFDDEQFSTFYKKYIDEKEFLLATGKQERLKPRKDVLYFVEYLQNDKKIAIYFFMPFNQTDNGQKLEMELINQIRFNIRDLKNGTYFINYSKDLFAIQTSYKKKKDSESLLTIDIPCNTIKICKVSNKILQKEKIRSIHALEKRRIKFNLLQPPKQPDKITEKKV